MGIGSFLGVKRPGRDVDHPPHLGPRLKKEYSYNLLPPWGFVACSKVHFTFNFLPQMVCHTNSIIKRHNINLF